jgi:hypothetical protein
MSSNDPSSDLDSRISAIVESSVGRMRDELMHRMHDTEARLRDIVSRLGGEDATTPAPGPAPQSPTVEAAAPAGDAAPDLFDAVVAMDRGSSQQEVLAALLEGVGRFAGRSALFLTRSDGAQGWGSYGFEGTASDIQEIVLSYSEGPLATLAEGRGCVPLTAEECGDFCRRMGVASGTEGLLVPFVLRDRLAAALYVDRSADDAPLGRRSLQLMTYVGAQAVEGLALRQRSETPTLQVATEQTDTPGVALWEAPPTEPPAPAATVPTEPIEVEPPEPVATEPPEPVVTEPPEPVVTEPPEPVVTEPPEPVATEPLEPAVTEPLEPVEPSSEMSIEQLAEETTPAGLVTEAIPVIEKETETVADDAGEVPVEPMAEPPAEPELSSAAPVAQPTQPLESLVEPVTETPADEPQPWAGTAGTDLSTVEAEPPAAPPEIEVMPTAEGATDQTETSEVQPPTDVSGPGWAFTASRATADAGDDAQHEEARRLARLLVTEIKLYNEEQVEEGRRGNDIYARLREDIDRSRQIFNERVDDAVRQETDYFHEEMVRILAGGNAEALGV